MGLTNKAIRKLISSYNIFILKVIYRKKIFIGKKLSIRKRFDVRIKDNSKIIIGNNVFFNNDCSLNCMKKITIGDNCIFGEGVRIYDHNHKFRNKEQLIRNQGYRAEKIDIGNNCWFGSNVVVLPGVKIGSNSVIGTGCIIYKDIPENAIVKNKQCQEIDINI